MKITPGLHPEMRCAYCDQHGYVTITQSKGDIGPGLDKKAATAFGSAASSPGLVDGLMRKQKVTFAECGRCMMSWKYTKESIA